MTLDAHHIARLQAAFTADWHVEPPAATGEGFDRLISENHLRNFQLWHEEDIARHARRIVRLRDGLIESDGAQT